MGLILQYKKELIYTDLQKIGNTIRSPYGKGNVEFLCPFRGSFIDTNNPSGSNCFYLNKNN